MRVLNARRIGKEEGVSSLHPLTCFGQTAVCIDIKFDNENDNASFPSVVAGAGDAVEIVPNVGMLEKDFLDDNLDDVQVEAIPVVSPKEVDKNISIVSPMAIRNEKMVEVEKPSHFAMFLGAIKGFIPKDFCRIMGTKRPNKQVWQAKGKK